MNNRWKARIEALALNWIATLVIFILAPLGAIAVSIKSNMHGWGGAVLAELILAAAMTAFMIQNFYLLRIRRRDRLRIAGSQGYSSAHEGGEAYILLKVEPRYSEKVALELSEFPAVDYAAAVFGQWDIITHVRTGNSGTLIHFLTQLQHVPGVTRTETLIVRADQLREYPHPSHLDGHWAFLLLRSPPKKADMMLASIGNMLDGDRATVQHAAGTLGPYDFALTIRYSGEDSLRKLVMDSIQEGPVDETLTLLAIQRMVFRKGVAVT